MADDPAPIKIGVIAEAQAVAGSSIPQAAQIAADEINAKGGVDGRKIEIVSYDNHSSSAESVRAFQRAVNEDHVNAVIGSYISEVVLALEPWAARLKTVFITPGAASDVITQNIAKDYEHNKYTFHGYLTSSAIAGLVCDAAKDMLVDGLKMKTAVIMSEDAAWTTPYDAGSRGLPAEDRAQSARPHPLLARHHRLHPDLQQDRGPEAGRDHHRHLACRHAADRAMEEPAGADPDVRHLVPGDQLDLLEGHQRRDRRRDLPGRFGSRGRRHAQDAAVRRRVRQEIRQYASYCGYTAYDDVYMIADAIKRAGSLDSDKLVDAMEKTDYVGTIGRVQFLPKGDPHVHGLKTGPGFITGLDAAMAGRQADQHVAGGTRQRQARIPLLRQDRIGGN